MNIRYYYSRRSCSELIITSHAARKYPWHMHFCHWSIGWLCSGTASLLTQTGSRTLVRGDHFIIPPNVAHCLSTAANTTLVVFCVSSLEDTEVHANSFFDSLHDIKRRNSLLTQISFEDWTNLRMLTARLSDHSKLKDAKKPISPIVQTVAETLQESPDQSYPVNGMASSVGYSQWHFLRLFQKETGLTPHAYQMNCRLRMLRSLLRTGVAAVDAAMSAGFSDQSHMHKLFKRHHGLTPKKFRNASVIFEP